MTIDVTIDFETRSPVPIKTAGMYVYAAHALTEPMCLSIAIGAAPPIVWVPDCFREKIDPVNIRFELVDSKTIIEAVMAHPYIVAHNSMFEFLIWNWVMVPRYGWPPLPMEWLHDTQAQLAYHALPLRLEEACKALNLSIQKDMDGYKSMMKLCKPRKPRKAEKQADPGWADRLYWFEGQADLENNINYCCRDVEAERLIHHSLPKLPASERQIWLLDQKINLTGVHVDLPAVNRIVAGVKQQEHLQVERFRQLTGGAVSGPRSYVALKEWVNHRTGWQLPSINKEVTQQLLEHDGLPADVRQVLEIKSELSKSSVAKHNAIISRSGADHRFRGIAQYHGASTGRWAGRGVQIHNLPRDSYDEDTYTLADTYFQRGDMDALARDLDSPFFAASRMIRGAFTAAPGKVLVCADFSAIEGRGLAYLADEQWVLQAYIDGLDMYKVGAASVLGKNYEDITKQERQSPGKPVELGCGYQGAAGAIRQFGGGLGMTDQEINEKWVYPWRKARPRIVRFWQQMEKNAHNAVQNPGQVYSYRQISFHCDGRFLRIYLPSGRPIHYYKPWVEKIRKRKPDADCPHTAPCHCNGCTYEKNALFYMGMRTAKGKTTTRFTAVQTYGGKLTENVVQGFSRDLLGYAMVNLDANGYPLVLHVHDEAAGEIPSGSEPVRWDEKSRVWRPERFEKIMESVPPWAAGMPIKAAGWIGLRYRK